MIDSALLAFYSWQDTIELLDWPDFLFALAYAIASLMAYNCARSSTDHRTLLRFWTASAIVLLVIGTDTVLCFSTFITEWMREIARIGGWYDSRHAVQYKVLVGIGLASLLLTGKLSRAIDTVWHLVQMEVISIIMLISLFLLRTVSFHDTDAVLGTRFGQDSLQTIFELIGLGLSLTGSRWFMRHY
jgi:hypothetical protein